MFIENFYRELSLRERLSLFVMIPVRNALVFDNFWLETHPPSTKRMRTCFRSKVSDEVFVIRIVYRESYWSPV